MARYSVGVWRGMPWMCWLMVALVGFLAVESHAAKNYKPIVSQIMAAALNNTRAYERLCYMCDTFGPRLSGSTNLENALDWIMATMRTDGIANVTAQPVNVTKWERNNESLYMIAPRPHQMAMKGLGPSIATPPSGITANAIVFRSLSALRKDAASAKGKIVVLNIPFESFNKNEPIQMRLPIIVGKYGAVAVLLRSLATYSLYTPHAGETSYSDDVPKIPAATITLEDAEMLQRMQDRGQQITLKLTMEAKSFPQSLSRNIIAELPGTTIPKELVVIGAHSDSWDVGSGAMDDGGGCIISWEVLNLLRSQALIPRRTIRTVLWTNEEFGGTGASAYFEGYKRDLNNTVFAMETDDGLLPPVGLQFMGTRKALGMLRGVAELLLPWVNIRVEDSDEVPADVSELAEAGVPSAGLLVDNYLEQRPLYFWFHHTNADTPDKINPIVMNQCLGVWAAVAYVVADMEETMPRMRPMFQGK